MSKIGIDEYDPEAGMSDSDWIKEKADQEDGVSKIEEVKDYAG